MFKAASLCILLKVQITHRLRIYERVIFPSLVEALGSGSTQGFDSRLLREAGSRTRNGKGHGSRQRPATPPAPLREGTGGSKTSRICHKGGTLKGLKQRHSQGTFQGCVCLREHRKEVESEPSPRAPGAHLTADVLSVPGLQAEVRCGEAREACSDLGLHLRVTSPCLCLLLPPY